MFRFVFAASLAMALSVQAQDSASSASPDDSILAKFTWKTGHIDLPGGKAALELPAGYRYLGPDDAKIVIEKLWGNPDGSGTLGMLFAPGEEPVGDSSYGVVVQYDDGGHIDDKDAAKTDFDELLKTMQKSTEDANEDRKKEGYHALHLGPWAEPPHYDEAQKKLYWAKTLYSDESAGKTLNYFVRILGREGVLELAAVSDVNQLAKVKVGMSQLNDVAAFTKGNQYADFNSSTDKLSELGIAALIGGGVAVAAKAGLFKGLLIGLLALKKFIVIGFLAVGAAIKAWWSNRKKNKEESENKFGGSDFKG